MGEVGWRDVDLSRDVRFVGVAEVEITAEGARTHRLPAWARAQMDNPVTLIMQAMPAGAHIGFETDSDAVELTVTVTRLELEDMSAYPSVPPVVDLIVDGVHVDRQIATSGPRHIFGIEGTLLRTEPGTIDTLRFGSLGRSAKRIELWLPQRAPVLVNSIRVRTRSGLVPERQDRRLWVHYGSSISHCMDSAGPIDTWPATVALHNNVALTNLAMSGECHLDPFVARVIRDTELDLVSLKIGVNIVGSASMTRRTFVPALHGFLDTIRERHTAVPIVISSSIVAPLLGDPEPSADGSGPRSDLTMHGSRELLKAVVEQRQTTGDTNVHYLHGPELFGHADVEHLSDGLHPTTVGYELIASRFSAAIFADGGPFGLPDLLDVSLE